MLITEREFLEMLPTWNRQGVYAVFTHRGPIPFKMSEMQEAIRYRALTNFEWTLELAIPDGTNHWGQMISPNKMLIDQLSESARELLK